MHIVKRLAIALATCLAIGAGLAATPDVVQPQPASAFYVTVKVSPSSERTIRVCDLSRGYGICKNVGAGHWSPIAVQSVQVDNGCQLFRGGDKIADRKGHDWWYNFDQILHGKATISLKNCRSTGRGDVAPRN